MRATVFLATLALACGAKTPAPGPECDGGAPKSSGGITGYVTCTPINAIGAASYSFSQLAIDGGSATVGDEIVILDSAGVCNDLTTDTAPANETYIDVTLLETDSNGNQLQPTAGDFTVSNNANGKIATIIFGQNVGCAPYIVAGEAIGGQATSGTVHVTSIDLADGGGIVGTLNLNFGSDEIAGAFNAPYCGGSISTGTPACE